MSQTDQPTIVGDKFEVLDKLAQGTKQQSATQLGVGHEVLKSLQNDGLIERLPPDMDSSLFRLTALGHEVWTIERRKPVE